MKLAMTALGALALGALVQDPARERLKAALKDTDLKGDWIYDDLPAGFGEAKKSGKPLMVVLRCPP